MFTGAEAQAYGATRLYQALCYSAYLAARTG